MSDQDAVYVGRADCGCIRAVLVDYRWDRGLNAKEIARWIREGLTLERSTVGDVRASKLTRADCAVHTTQLHVEQGALL
jgi:hypothetical protein